MQKKKKMQLCNTLKRWTVQENYLFKPWKKMESEITDFDISKSVIGITDIRMVGKTLKILLYSLEVVVILYLAYNCRAELDSWAVYLQWG